MLLPPFDASSETFCACETCERPSESTKIFLKCLCTARGVMAILLSFARTFGLKGRLHVWGWLFRRSSVIVPDRKQVPAGN